MQELLRKSAMEQFSAIKDKKVSAIELTKASLDRINAIDEKLGSFNSLTEEIALALTEENAANYGIENLEEFKANFRRDTSYVPVLPNVFSEGYSVDSLAYVPGFHGKKFELATTMHKTVSGIEIPLFEAKVSYKDYLEGLNKQEIINLTKTATELGKYEGLKVGDIYSPNNNA